MDQIYLDYNATTPIDPQVQDGQGQHNCQASPGAHGEKGGFSAQGKPRHGGEQLFE